jgi:hypothetical protein
MSENVLICLVCEKRALLKCVLPENVPFQMITRVIYVLSHINKLMQ